MTDPDEHTSETPATEPTFLSSLPDRPITDDVVRQIGESDHPRVRGAMGLPVAGPGSKRIEAFLLDLDTKTYVLVFDPAAKRWRTYDSFGTEDMNHDEIVDRATEIANEWLVESLADRIAAAEETDSDGET